MTQPLHDLHQALRSAGYAPLRTITASIKNNELVLDGRVPTFFLKAVAQTIALKIAGRHPLRNNVIVC